ncbi:xanthine dehydrogenase accessory protein XdhC [Pseudoduganella sp. RAF53_2]|uniref:xanthine dehydrogenase accessory protein XdhC n=1 Tax=unclassified Pseudoduganella TaxID=2637179 RepID=UPI003F97E33B
MSGWMTAPGAPAVLVTVARVEGSAPREAGTKMLVTADTQFDTIGGGHLEHRAFDIARSMLAEAASGGNGRSAQLPRYERFPLGPRLGQCCGGVVWLTFELVSGEVAAVLAALRERRWDDSWRYVALDGDPMCAVVDAQGHLLAGVQPPADLPHGPAGLATDATGRRWLVDPCLTPRAHLVLFGAGHVGAAIVRALGELPCTVTWVDERDDMFPSEIPANVRIEATDTPEACVDEAPPHASYLVMTHSHALDQRLSEAILARADVGWFGLIGSKTKRAQFTSRLEAKGFSAERMVCPVGIPGIINKAPAVIAASVAAQLLMVWEDQTKE